MKVIKYKQKFWLAVWHTIFGHPKRDCTKTGELEVQCICGTYISLSDYY